MSRRQQSGITVRTWVLSLLIVVIVLVWAINILAGLVVRSWEPDAGVNAVMAGLLTLLGVLYGKSVWSKPEDELPAPVLPPPPREEPSGDS